MAEYIDREKLKEAIREDAINSLQFCDPSALDLALMDVDEAPSADVRPVVRGRFVHDGPRFAGGVDWWHCSNCGSLVSGVETRFAFCPHCGADMRQKKEGIKNEND